METDPEMAQMLELADKDYLNEQLSQQRNGNYKKEPSKSRIEKYITSNKNLI